MEYDLEITSSHGDTKVFAKRDWPGYRQCHLRVEGHDFDLGKDAAIYANYKFADLVRLRDWLNDELSQQPSPPRVAFLAECGGWICGSTDGSTNSRDMYQAQQWCDRMNKKRAA